MRRDLCYYFAADVCSVYNAYLMAAGNQQFRRECRQEPYHTLGFGLNFSMKHNMNGGSCTIHFIPYQGGTAVDLRFSIAQLAGARYKRYAADLTNTVIRILNITAQPIRLNIEEFTKECNKVVLQRMPESVSLPQNVAKQSGFCINCGKQIDNNNNFCIYCGTRIHNA